MTNVCDLCGEHPAYEDTLYCMACVVKVREESRCPDCSSAGSIGITAGQPGIWSVIVHDPTCPLWSAKRAAGEHNEFRTIIEGTRP